MIHNHLCLVDLPTEVLLVVVDHLPSMRDKAALASTCTRTNQISLDEPLFYGRHITISAAFNDDDQLYSFVAWCHARTRLNVHRFNLKVQYPMDKDAHDSLMDALSQLIPSTCALDIKVDPSVEPAQDFDFSVFDELSSLSVNTFGGITAYPRGVQKLKLLVDPDIDYWHAIFPKLPDTVTHFEMCNFEFTESSEDDAGNYFCGDVADCIELAPLQHLCLSSVSGGDDRLLEDMLCAKTLTSLTLYGLAGINPVQFGPMPNLRHLDLSHISRYLVFTSTPDNEDTEDEELVCVDVTKMPLLETLNVGMLYDSFYIRDYAQVQHLRNHLRSFSVDKKPEGLTLQFDNSWIHLQSLSLFDNCGVIGGPMPALRQLTLGGPWRGAVWKVPDTFDPRYFPGLTKLVIRKGTLRRGKDSLWDALPDGLEVELRRCDVSDFDLSVLSRFTVTMLA